MPLDIWKNAPFKPFGITGVDPADLPRPVLDAAFSVSAPTPDQIAAVEEEQNNGLWGTIGTILSIPEKVLFGQAIKGGVKGFIEGGVGGAVEGFARGTPFAFLGEALGLGDIARETSFAQIRRATGQTDVEEGAANFLINLAGDVLLSPVELLAAPLAITKAGKVATAAGRATAKASLAAALASGERAALVFKLPWAESGFAATNLGFKSGVVTLGQGLDAIGSFLRTNQVTAPLVKTFSSLALSADPEIAKLGTVSREAMDATRREVYGKTLMAYLDGVTPQGRALVESGKYRKIITTLNEFGISKIDDAGSFDDVMRKLASPDVTLRQLRADALIRSDRSGVVGALWSRAAEGDVAAIKTLYARHKDIPLPTDMLEAAGLKPRVGVELSWTDAPNNGVVGALDEATRGLPGAAKSKQGKRLLAAEATPDAARQAALNARKEVQGEFAKLMADIESGVVKKEDLDSFLSVHRSIMEDLGRADIANGFLNDTMEPFLGLYAPRIMSQKARQAIDAHFAATLSKYNYSSPRKLSEMLAVEANAIAEDFGMRVTGFVPLRDLKKHGADGVFAKIFDRTFQRTLAAIDPRAAEFFQILPTQNIFERAAASGDRAAFASLGKTFFADDAASVTRVLSPEQYAKEGIAYGPGTGYRAIVETKSAVKTPTLAEAAEMRVAKEIEAQYEVAAHTIKEDALTRMNATDDAFEATYRELREALDITSDSAPGKLQQAKGEAYATNQMKRAANDLRRAKEERDLAKRLLDIHRKRSKGLPVTADADALARYDDMAASFKGGPDALAASLKERAGRASDVLRSRTEYYDASKRAVRDFIDELDSTLDTITGELKGDIKAARQARRDELSTILTGRDQRLDIVSRLRKSGMDGRSFAREVALQAQHERHGVMALDEAADIIDGATGKTKLDVLRERWGKDAKIKIVTEDAFNAYRQLADDVAKPDALRNNGLARFFDSVKTAWAGHTIYNPLFLQTRVRNFVQSTAAAASFGLFSPAAHFEAREALGVFSKSLKEGSAALGALAGRTVRGTEVSLLDGLQHARRLGIVGGAGYAYEVGLTLEQAAARSASATVKGALKDWRSYVDAVVPTRGVADSPLLQLGLRMENTLDDHARLAAFFGAMKKGASPEDAASMVRRALYDSSKPMSWTERTIFRRLIPFYSFQKYALGQAADLYLSRPAAVTSIEKIRRNAFAATGMKPEELDTAMPGFIADGYAIPYKNTEKGPVFGLFGTYLPIGEVSRLASMFDDYARNPDGADPALRYFVGNMHPVLKSLVESTLNRDLYSNREISAFPGESLEMFGIPMPKIAVRFAQQLRFVNELNKLNVLNFTEAQTLLSEVKRFRSEDTDVIDRLASSAFSPLPYPQARAVNIEQEGKYRNKKDEARFREMKGRLVRATIGEEKAFTDANVEALRTDMAETAARIRRRDRLMGRYSQDDPERPTPPRSALERLMLGR